MKNIELKVKITDFKVVRATLKKMSAKRVGTLRQVDTYYRCASGRLKIREINGKHYELIFYQRPDMARSRISRYHVLPVQKYQLRLMKALLRDALGQYVVVKKAREFWLYKHTRILLDTVVGLGKFLELETVCKALPMAQAKIEHRNVMSFLSLGSYKKLEKSYADMPVKR